MRSPRRSSVLVWAMVIVGFTIPIAFGVWQLQDTLNPSNLGIFSKFMSSPIQLVLPLVAVGVGCARLYQDVGHRFIASLRTRMSVETYLRATVGRAVLGPLIALGGSVVLVGAISFALWPVIGNPFVDPSVYHLDPDAPPAPDLARFTYSEAMQGGWPLYVVAYAALFGVACALFSALGAAAWA